MPLSAHTGLYMCASYGSVNSLYQRATYDSYRGRLLPLATDQPRPNPHWKAGAAGAASGGGGGGGEGATHIHTDTHKRISYTHMLVHPGDNHLLPLCANRLS